MAIAFEQSTNIDIGSAANRAVVVQFIGDVNDVGITANIGGVNSGYASSSANYLIGTCLGAVMLSVFYTW